MIARDGATISLWQQSTNSYNGKNPFANQEFDAIIAGGGITGVSTALILQKAGRDHCVTGVQTCALPIYHGWNHRRNHRSPQHAAGHALFNHDQKFWTRKRKTGCAMREGCH